jgi:pimeloyl-ACP methyl ester carboxylesterase
MSSLTFQSLRLSFRVTGALLPKFSGFLASQLFLRPKRIKRPKWEEDILKTANWNDLVSGTRVWQWGEGPKILLVHGWDGRGSQLGRFVEPLLKVGFSVVMFDGPAHGDSQGVKTSMKLQASTIEKLSEEFGPFSGVIAHSFGGGASLHALHRGLPVSRAVLIGTPSRIRGIFDQFAAFWGLRKKARVAFQRSVEKEVGISVDDLEHSLRSPNSISKLLVVHDREDKEVPFESALEIQQNWPGSELLETTGSGHRQILKSPLVIGQVTRFLKLGVSSATDGK